MTSSQPSVGAIAAIFGLIALAVILAAAGAFLRRTDILNHPVVNFLWSGLVVAPLVAALVIYLD